MPAKTIDISEILDARRITAFNIVLLVLSFLVEMADGYDLGAAAFAGPSLIKEFGLSGPQLGLLFSLSLATGVVGTPLFGYLSDRFGRKRVIVGGALFFGAFTLLTVWARTFEELLVVRIIASIGLAGISPIVVALNNEFAPRRIRATMVVLMFTGITFGGGLPGLIAAHYMGDYGWRLLFWIGGIAPMAIAVLLAMLLPESVKFLALKPQRRPELVARMQALRPDLDIAPDTRFVIGGERNRERFSIGALFEGRLAVLTPLIWVTNVVSLMVFYFINQWMPTVLAGSGVSLENAAIATTLFQFGGTLAGLLSMRFLDLRGFIPVPILYALAIPIVVAIGIPGLPQLALIGLVAAAGFCLLGSQFGNIASEANIYPTYVRSWGVGLCFAVARVGGALGPYVGGLMFGAKLARPEIFLIAAAPLVLGLAAGIAIVPLYRRQIGETATAVDLPLAA